MLAKRVGSTNKSQMALWFTAFLSAHPVVKGPLTDTFRITLSQNCLEPLSIKLYLLCILSPPSL